MITTSCTPQNWKKKTLVASLAIIQTIGDVDILKFLSKTLEIWWKTGEKI
jgi:hypothetical protein